MKNYITVVGSLPIKFDIDQAKKVGPVIASANSNKSITFDYATVNTETNLQDMLNSPNFQNTNLLAPEKLFKKYRKTREGKAADSFVRFLDGIPTWLTIALSILIGGLLFGRIWFSGVNDDGEYLGGGRTVGGSSLSSVSDDFE